MSGGIRVANCACCFLPPWRCVCPYFHTPQLHCLLFEPKIDHRRSNPFGETVIKVLKRSALGPSTDSAG